MRTQNTNPRNGFSTRKSSRPVPSSNARRNDDSCVGDGWLFLYRFRHQARTCASMPHLRPRQDVTTSHAMEITTACASQLPPITLAGFDIGHRNACWCPYRPASADHTRDGCCLVRFRQPITDRARAPPMSLAGRPYPCVLPLALAMLESSHRCVCLPPCSRPPPRTRWYSPLRRRPLPHTGRCTPRCKPLWLPLCTGPLLIARAPCTGHCRLPRLRHRGICGREKDVDGVETGDDLPEFYGDPHDETTRWRGQFLS